MQLLFIFHSSEYETAAWSLMSSLVPSLLLCAACISMNLEMGCLPALWSLTLKKTVNVIVIKSVNIILFLLITLLFIFGYLCLYFIQERLFHLFYVNIIETVLSSMYFGLMMLPLPLEKSV